jgi:hypothetical protein
VYAKRQTACAERESRERDKRPFMEQGMLAHQQTLLAAHATETARISRTSLFGVRVPTGAVLTGAAREIPSGATFTRMVVTNGKSCALTCEGVPPAVRTFQARSKSKTPLEPAGSCSRGPLWRAT